MHSALGAAHRALPRPATDPLPDIAPAREHVARWGWRVAADSPALQTLAGALEALAAAGFPAPEDLLDRYAQAAGELGEQDVAEVPETSVAEAVRFVVVNTVLLEPVPLALRRLAQEDASGRRFPDGAC